jgi:hypothetical protein
VKEPGETAQASNIPIEGKGSSTVRREPNAVYQGERVVARVLNAEVDLEAKEIHFEELYESDYLMLPEECEYQRYKIMVQRVAYATKAQAGAAQRGRVLKGVVADILGYQEQ